MIPAFLLTNFFAAVIPVFQIIMLPQRACRFTENCTSCGGAKGSKREEMKDLVTELRKKSEFIDSNIFNSVSNVDLKTIIGYKKDGEYHNFLDNYDAE